MYHGRTEDLGSAWYNEGLLTMGDSSGIDAEIAVVFQRLFGLAPNQLNREIRRGQLERWDSLGHLDLLEALRTEFGIDIPPEQALDMETVADVERVVSSLRKPRR